MSNENASLKLKQVQQAIEATFVGQKELVKLVKNFILSHILL